MHLNERKHNVKDATADKPYQYSFNYLTKTKNVLIFHIHVIRARI